MNMIIRQSIVQESQISVKQEYLDVLQEMVKSAITKGANQFEIIAEKDWDGYIEYYDITFYKSYIETDDERIVREEKEALQAIKEQEAYNTMVEQQEKETLRKLKEKYENNN